MSVHENLTNSFRFSYRAFLCGICGHLGFPFAPLRVLYGKTLNIFG
jgi:hypothetical protein